LDASVGLNARHDRAGLRFHLINPDTGNRIRMITQDGETGDELECRSLVKGYEFRKGKYLLLGDDDLDSVKVESSSVMTIEKFVESTTIDPVYYDAAWDGHSISAPADQADAGSCHAAFSRTPKIRRNRGGASSRSGHKAQRSGNPKGLPAVKVSVWGVKGMPGQILVLVAEDEELVRLVIVEALEDAGFEVIEAGHADAALGVLQIHSARIHVLFTDIQMPGAMDGLALAHHTAKNWPKIALLITSARPRPDRASLPRKSRFLAKPYRHHHVIRHIRELAAAA
jgi:CheY-like chemotaxis protein